jgi:hypothetical protein
MRDAAAAGCAHAALARAASWSDAVGEAHIGAAAPTGGAATAAAALFAMLSKTGARGWGLGRGGSSGGASAGGPDGVPGGEEGAPDVVRMACIPAGRPCRRRSSLSDSEPAPSRRASRRGSLRGGERASSGGGAAAAGGGEADADGVYELIQVSALAGLEGPLSRSINLQKQRSAAAAEAAQLLGRSLHQVPEGEREGVGACARGQGLRWGSTRTQARLLGCPGCAAGGLD